MPKFAEPPKPELPPNRVQVAGKQEHFQQAGFELAAALGASGEPHLESESGLRVEDAQNYCVKLLHENFQAGAKGEEQPDYKAACVHLGVDDDAEQLAIDTATKVAYEAGKGTTVTEVEGRVAHLTADTSLTAAGLAAAGVPAAAGKVR